MNRLDNYPDVFHTPVCPFFSDFILGRPIVLDDCLISGYWTFDGLAIDQV